MGLTRTSRRGLLRASAAAGVATAAALPAGTARGSRALDDRVVAYLLELERLQAAFYAAAVDGKALTGEVREFATVVADHERRHVAYLRGLVDDVEEPRVAYDFEDAVSTPELFTAAAIELEDAAVAGYSGAIVNLSRGRLREATRVVSVEARHAAWARDLAGRNPAPVAADVAKGERAIRAIVARTGFVKAG